jgi:short-subunit dehydrogenase
MSWALVTGASSGIGAAFAKSLAQRKYDLVLVARREQRLQQLADTLTAEYGVNIVIQPLDITLPEARKQLKANLEQHNITPEMLVNNAGIGQVGRFEAIDMCQYQRTIDLNCTALTALISDYLPAMQQQQKGYILNVSSVSGLMPGPNLALYHASKNFVQALSEALWQENRHRGVVITASCPGPTESEFHQHAGSDKIGMFKRIGLMSADAVAEQALNATLAGKRRVVHGWLNRLMASSARLTPKALLLPITQRIMS